MKLRRIAEADLPTLFEQRNNPDIYKWCRQHSPLHWENHVAWYKAQAKDQSLSMFVLEIRGVIVGVCGLTSIDMVNRRAEFSLYIDADYHGKGFGKYALGLLLDHGFNALGLNRIWGESFSNNEKALGMFKSLGFEVEGVRRDFYFRDGHYIGATLVSIGRDSFYHLRALSSPEPVEPSKANC